MAMNLKLKAAVVGTLAGVLAVSSCSASGSANDTIDVVGEFATIAPVPRPPACR